MTDKPARKSAKSAVSYVELHACSAFNFLRGASVPEQIVETCAELELPAIALHDRDGVYGAPRFWEAAREQGIRPILGCEITMEDGAILPVLVENRTGYRNLCELITQAKLRGTKTECATRWDELPRFAEGLVALAGEGILFSSNRSLRSRREQSEVLRLRSAALHSAQDDSG